MIQKDNYRKHYNSNKNQTPYQFSCHYCEYESPYQGNMIKHLKNHHADILDVITPDTGHQGIFEHKDHNIPGFVSNLLLWKCRYGISIRALKDPLANLNHLDQYSREELSEMISSIATQIKEIHMKRYKGRYISITLDAGTVHHEKWLAIGAIFPIGNETDFNVFDVFVRPESITSESLVQDIKVLQEQLKQQNTKIVGVTTDNASNFVKTFSLEFVDELHIFRISCSAHTVQLALKDFLNSTEELYNIKDLIKSLPQMINSLSRTELRRNNLNTLPTWQEQRWNNFSYILNAVISQYNSIQQLLTPEQRENFDQTKLTILYEALWDVTIFTNQIEGDTTNLSTLYCAYKHLKQKLIEKNTDYSLRLLQEIEARFHSTANIQIAKLVYYCTNKGIEKVRIKYEKATQTVKDDKNEEQERLDACQAYFLFQEKILSICDLFSPYWTDLEIASGTKLRNLMSKFLQEFVPDPTSSDEFPRLNEISYYFKDFKHAQYFYDFLTRLKTLPASEGHSERIFSKMRRLFNDNMSRLSSEMLRNELICAYYACEQKRNPTKIYQEYEAYDDRSALFSNGR